MALISKKFKSILLILIPLVTTLSLTLFFQRTILNNPEAIQEWLKSFGILIIFAYIILQSISIIFAPIGGFAVALAILAIFGPFWGFMIIYLVTTPLYIINFLIARKFGKRVVERFVGGKEGMKLVDKYSQKMTPEILIILKFFLGSYSDYLSYAAGFTNISLKSFVLISFIVALPNTVLGYLIFHFSPNFSTAVLLTLILPFVMGTLYLPFHKKVKKYLENKNLFNREV